MKYIFTFLVIVIVGGGIALSLVGVPAPKSEIRIPITLNEQNKK